MGYKEERLLLVLIYSLQQFKNFKISNSTAELHSRQTADRNNTAAIFNIMRLLLFKDCSMEKLSCFRRKTVLSAGSVRVML